MKNVHDSRWPNLFIVGTPRSGTTFLSRMLKQHPNIYLPKQKEPCFFGKDLHRRLKRYSEEEYLSFYANRIETYRMDASPSTIMSDKAAEEILAVSPDAHIIVCVRHPMGWFRSMFLHHQRSGEERGTADEAMLRTKNECPPESMHHLNFYEYLFSRENYMALPSRIKAFQAAFPKRVHLVCLDDVKANPEATIQALIKNLALPECALDMQQNEDKNAFESDGRLMHRAPMWLRKLSGKCYVAYHFPHKMWHWGARPFLWAGYAVLRVVKKMINPQKRQQKLPPFKLSADVLRTLQHDMHAPIQEMEKLLERDLQHWRDALTHNS